MPAERLKQQQSETRAAEEHLLDALCDAGQPMAPGELQDEICTNEATCPSSTAIRRAIWNLVDQQLAAFTDQRRVTVTEGGRRRR